MIDLPIFPMVASLALGQSYDYPSAREVIMKVMDRICQHSETQKNKYWMQNVWHVLNTGYCHYFLICPVFW